MNGPVFSDIENNRIYAQSEVTDKDRCKLVPGCRWDKDKRRWHFPISWSTCKVLRSVFGDRLQIGPTLMEWAKTEVSERIAPSVALRDALSVTSSTDDLPFPKEIYPFQLAGSLFLATAQCAMNSDPMGAGKTIQTITAVRILQHQNGDALPALVVCPNTVKRAWSREVEKWWPGVPVFIVEGSAAKRKQILAEAALNPGFVIINYEAMRLHSRLAPYGSIALSDAEKTPKELNHIEWGTVICDESHRLKDPKSKQTRACWAVGHGL